MLECQGVEVLEYWSIGEFLSLYHFKICTRFIELGIPLRIGSEDLMAARAEVEAVRAWFAGTKDGS